MKKQIKNKILSVLATVSMLASLITALPVVAENAGDFVISVENGEAIITDFNKEYKGDVVIPSTLNGYPVTEIYKNAFNSRINIISVTIPGSVTSIGERAFQDCDNLKSVTLNQGITNIDYCAFYGCDNLTSIIIPEGITEIGESAFSGCRKLEKISLPKTLEEIGSQAFDYCPIEYIYYVGSTKDWEKISIGYHYNSDTFTNATIHYNSTMPNDSTVTPKPDTVTPPPVTITPVPNTVTPAPITVTPTPNNDDNNSNNIGGTTTIINNNTTNTIVTNNTETNNNITNNTITNNNITNNTNVTNNIVNNVSLILYIGKTTASVGGESVENDVAPIVRNDRTMLPARFVAEQLGAKVDWNQDLKQVIITKGDKLITIPIGSDKAYVNNVAQTLDSPAFVENDRTYTPVRFIAENLDADVQWNGDDQSVTITEK